MKITPRSEFKCDLQIALAQSVAKDAQHHKSGFILPTGWRGQLLTGFESLNTQVLDLTDDLNTEDFIDHLKGVYPKLGLTRLAHLYQMSEQLGFPFILTQYNLRATPELFRLFEVLRSLPQKIQFHIDERGYMAKELGVLRSMSLPHIEYFFDIAIFTRWSKQTCLQALELFSDLILMEKEVPAPQFPNDPDGTHWLKQLRELRFPRTTQMDFQQQSQLKTIPWPNRVRAEWKRHGDQSLLEITVSVQSGEELEKKLSELLKLQKNLSENKIWVRAPERNL